MQLKSIINTCFYTFVIRRALLSSLTMADNSTNTSSNYSAVYITTPNIDVAKKLAHGLVEKQLAACVNIIPQITSVYKWEGKINEDSELLLMVKTKTNRVEQLTQFVKQNHPYTVPEVISVLIQDGNPDYLKWIDEVVEGEGSSPSTKDEKQDAE